MRLDALMRSDSSVLNDMDNIQMSGTNHTNTTVAISTWYTTEPAALRPRRRALAFPGE